MIIFAILNFAGVVKLVDTLDLGSSASRCEGSSPFARTNKKASHFEKLFLFYEDKGNNFGGRSQRHLACLPAQRSSS